MTLGVSCFFDSINWPNPVWIFSRIFSVLSAVLSITPWTRSRLSAVKSSPSNEAIFEEISSRCTANCFTCKSWMLESCFKFSEILARADTTCSFKAALLLLDCWISNWCNLFSCSNWMPDNFSKLCEMVPMACSIGSGMTFSVLIEITLGWLDSSTLNFESSARFSLIFSRMASVRAACSSWRIIEFLSRESFSLIKFSNCSNFSSILPSRLWAMDNSELTASRFRMEVSSTFTDASAEISSWLPILICAELSISPVAELKTLFGITIVKLCLATYSRIATSVVYQLRPMRFETIFFWRASNLKYSGE